MGRISKETYRWAVPAVWRSDYRSSLREITAPTLILVGEHDRLTPPALSQTLQAGIRGARLAVVPGAGHLPNLEQPETFNRLVEAFLRDAERNPAVGAR